MKAMVLAAGRGRRMRPLTDNFPKPLLKVGHYALIEHLLFRLADNGFHEIVINIAHLGHQIKNYLGNGERYNVAIQYSEEDPNGGLETGGGIFNALPLLGTQPFLVVSGDIWTDYAFSRLKQKQLKGLAHLVLVNNPIDHANGDFSLIGESLFEDQGERLTFGNIGLYHPDLFKGCKPGFFPLGLLLRKAVANKLVTGEHFQGTWVNVGTPEILRELQASI